MPKSYLWGGILGLGIAIIGLLLAVKAHAPLQESSTVPTGETQSLSTTTESDTPAASEVTPQTELAHASQQARMAGAGVTTPATATLVVGGGSYALHAAAGSTLKDAMDQLQREGGFTYKYREYTGLGAFVTEIQGRASASEYWILYVNGKKSATGISSTHIRSGDVIEWKLEKSY